jgi:DNA-binding CsgD family transcriptional regulator
MSTNATPVRLRKDGLPDRRAYNRRAEGDRSLTAREKQITIAIAQGLTNAEICEQLGIGVKTVSWLRDSALKRIGFGDVPVRGDAMLTRLAIREGWVKP